MSHNVNGHSELYSEIFNLLKDMKWYWMLQNNNRGSKIIGILK